MTSQKSLGVWKHEDVALLVIDYQNEMFSNIRSTTPANIVELNTRLLLKTAKAFDIPVVLSSVGVTLKVNGPTRDSIANELPGQEVIDRSSMNAWDDEAFVKAVEATGKRRLIFAALYTEICLAFPVEDAMKAGYETMFVVDAVGGMTALGHDVAVSRLTAAGSVPNTSVALVTELFRDWKAPVSGKARGVFDWYWPELTKIVG